MSESKIKPARMLRGYLRSRKAIAKFLDGNSGREFRVRVVASDLNDSGDRLRPYESSYRDWYSPEIGWISVGDSIDMLDEARRKLGGVLKIVSYD